MRGNYLTLDDNLCIDKAFQSIRRDIVDAVFENNAYLDKELRNQREAVLFEALNHAKENEFSGWNFRYRIHQDCQQVKSG